MNQSQSTWSSLLRQVPRSTKLAIRRAIIRPSNLAPLTSYGPAILLSLLALPSLAAAQNTTVTLTPAGDPAPPWIWPQGAFGGGLGPPLVLTGTSNDPSAITGIAQVNIAMTHSYVGDGRIRLEFTPSTGPGAGVPVSVELLSSLGLTGSQFSAPYSSDLGGSYTFIDPPEGQNTFALMAANTNYVLPSGSYRAYGQFSVPTALSTSLSGILGTGSWRLLFDANAVNGSGTVSAASVTFTSGGCPGAWSALGAGASSAFAMANLPGGDVLIGDAGRYNPTTNTWTPLATRTNGTVFALAVTQSGDVIVGGSFTTAGGVEANNIARYNPTSGVWSALGAGVAGGTVYALAALPDGDVIAGGNFTSAGGEGVAVNQVARYNSNTNTWSPMGSGLVGGSQGPVAYDMDILPSGDVVIVGSFFAGGGIAAGGFIRYNPTTGAWINTAGPGIANYVSAVAVLPSGDVIAAGTAPVFPFGGGGPYVIGRYNPTTNLWTGLGDFTSGIVNSLETLPSGDVMVGGTFTIAGGVPMNRIARCNPDTNTWTPLGSGVTRTGFASVSSIAALPNGDAIAAGTFTSAGGVPVNNIARYTFGSLAPSISDNPSPQTACISETVTFSITASGPAPLAYQWRKGGVPIDSSAGPEGNPSAATATLTLMNVQLSDADVYDCIVTNAGGCGSVTSDPATLTICPGDFNCDGGIDGSDIESFFFDWEAGNSTADINEDGGIDGSDVEVFFGRWEAGC